jgi:phosphatidylserine/phosphatidylglycerophosphate/cardiolipin synthase-like enzyme
MPDVTGIVTEQGGGPIAGLRIELWRFDFDYGNFLWLTTFTDAAGRYTFSLSPVGLLLLNQVGYQIRAKSHVGRVVWKTAPFLIDFAGGTLTFNKAIAPGNMRGWLATNLADNGAPTRLTRNNFVTLLIENAVGWAALTDAIRAAQSEFNFMNFYHDIGKLFMIFDPDPPNLGSRTTGVQLEDVILEANRKSPPRTVRYLIRRAIPQSYPVHTSAEVIRFFQQNQPNTVAVRVSATDVRFPIHAKLAVIDSRIAFSISAPLLQEYYDTNTPEVHPVDDPRRGRLSKFPGDGIFGGQLKNSIRVPIHDVNLKIEGPAVADVHDTVFLHWNAFGQAEGGAPVQVPNHPSPNASVQLVRTLQGGRFPNLPQGETGIFESYLRAFEQANDYVYLEDQYLTEPQVCDAIRLTLLAAAARNSALQFILLINMKVDIPTYNSWQTKIILQLKEALKSDGLDSRLGIFTLWSEAATPTKMRIIRNYVHSKVGIVDDKWATIGSANLDGVSLTMSQFLVPPVREPDEHDRDTEVNATILSDVEGLPNSPIPNLLRRQLWAEHFGFVPNDSRLTTRPSGGWLSLWRQKAQEHLDALKATPPLGSPSRILEWQPTNNSEKYLKRLGVDIRQFKVMDEIRSFNFDTGMWLSDE